jgi:phosphohistidine phosphatase
MGIRRMLTLYLFRHAKSDWQDPRLKDLDRPLAARGRKAAPRMGAYLVQAGIRPALVLSSTSVRTRETCALAFALWSAPPKIRFEAPLYLASPATILALVRKLPTTLPSVMLVGHNPGLHETALSLAGHGDAAALSRLSAKFPTAALAEIAFDAAKWDDVRPGTGRLIRFVTPRSLEE